MSRSFDVKKFNEIFSAYICKGVFNEVPEYYPRYKSRYKSMIRQYANLAPDEPQKVLDVGGGQLALLANKLWGDEASAVDIGGEHLDYLASQGLHTITHNLCSADEFEQQCFDYIFFSEVIEHLPIPGHIALEKLKRALKPGGTIICSTPNLYRPRNIVFLILGRRIFDYFRYSENEGLGHVLEYSYDHLLWQFQRAGFEQCQIHYEQMHHFPNNLIMRALYILGMPMFIFPRWRDNLVAIAKSPA